MSTDSSYVTSGEDIHVYICHNIYGQLICKNFAAAVGTVSECTNTTTPTNVPSTRSGQLKNNKTDTLGHGIIQFGQTRPVLLVNV